MTEHWFHKNWRPYIAWQYGVICAFDFVLLPMLYFWLQQFEVLPQNDAYREWKPLTLQGGGLFHMAHMAIVGVSAYGRSQEKIGGVTSTPMSMSQTTFTETETIKTASPRPSMREEI